MLSYYHKLKTKTEEFKTNAQKITDELIGKKVVLYGATEGFKKLDKEYGFTKKLNIVAVVDECLTEKSCSTFCGIKAISRDRLLREEFDAILIANEISKPIAAVLEAELAINKENIKVLFEECVQEECANINYLCEQKFEKTLPKLVKQMKGKKVLLYGAGVYLEAINKYFDLSGLDIVGVSDKKFACCDCKQSFLGWEACGPQDIKDINPDYVLISTKFYVNIFEYLHFDLLKGANIKVKPLVQKPFFTLLKEVI